MSTETLSTNCPLCGAELHPVQVRNSLSRYDREAYICSKCGTMEGLAMPVVHDRLPAGTPRTVLYFDEVIGIVKVTENEAGYRPLFSAPFEQSWARSYVDKVNKRLGCDSSTAFKIVASSFTAQNEMEEFLGVRER